MQMASYSRTMAGAKQIIQPPKWTPYKRPSRAKPKPSEISPEEIRRRSLAIFRRRGMPVWAREIVEDVANRTGVSLDKLAGDRRFRRVVYARNEAIYLVKDRKPTLSMPILAKWFARDHTSCLHSIASHSELTGASALVGYDLNRVRRQKAAFNRWKREQARAAA